MTEKRDPRIDPRPGDVLKGEAPDGTMRILEIHAVRDGWVYVGKLGALGGGKMPLDEYRPQAQSAEVIYAAD